MEYFLIFNVFFGMNFGLLFFGFSEYEIFIFWEGCGCEECWKYEVRNVNIFKIFD